MKVIDIKDQVETAIRQLIQKSKDEGVILTSDSDYASSFVELVSGALNENIFVSIVYIYRATLCIEFLLEHEYVEGDSDVFHQRQAFLFKERNRMTQIAHDRLYPHHDH